MYHVISFREWIVDRDDFNVWTRQGRSEHETAYFFFKSSVSLLSKQSEESGGTNTTESVDTDFDNHDLYMSENAKMGCLVNC